MSKAVLGIAVVALVVSMIALGGFAFTYVMVAQAIHSAQSSNNGNNNQQTSVTSNGNSQTTGGCTYNCNSQSNNGCTSNCNSQTNGGCTSNCTGGGANGTIVTVVSGTTTTLDQCQGTSNG